MPFEERSMWLWAGRLEQRLEQRLVLRPDYEPGSATPLLETFRLSLLLKIFYWDALV